MYSPGLLSYGHTLCWGAVPTNQCCIRLPTEPTKGLGGPTLITLHTERYTPLHAQHKLWADLVARCGQGFIKEPVRLAGTDETALHVRM